MRLLNVAQLARLPVAIGAIAFLFLGVFLVYPLWCVLSASVLTADGSAFTLQNYARVLSRTPTEIVATIGVRQGPLHGEFTTRNTLESDRRIRLELVRGPFHSLQGDWLLTPIEPDGCRVELTMRFAFAHRITAMLFEPKFAATIASLVDAFVARARSQP